jgi:hypothetical protein
MGAIRAEILEGPHYARIFGTAMVARSPAAPSTQLADCLDHREPGAHRPLGIVLMRLRIAEMTVSGSDIHFDLSRSSPCAAAR